MKWCYECGVTKKYARARNSYDNEVVAKALFYGLENSGYFLRFLANLNSGQSQYRKENRAKTNQTSG